MGFFDKKSSSSSSNVVNNNQVTAPLTAGLDGDFNVSTSVSGKDNTIVDGGAIKGALALAETALGSTLANLDRSTGQSEATLATALNLVNPNARADQFAEITKQEINSKVLIAGFIAVGTATAVYFFKRKS